MEKKTISVHAFTVHIYTVAIVLLLLLVVVLGVKYVHLKLAVRNYTNSTIWMNEQGRPTGQVSDYGLIIGQSAQSLPAADLQTYVTTLSTQLNRDIVVLDKNKKVIADTLSSNKGSVYAFDEDSEIVKTMEDGQTRTFLETSGDYQKGILEVVVPMKNSKGEIVGAVLVSNTPVK